jgi:hypothetical protein
VTIRSTCRKGFAVRGFEVRFEGSRFVDREPRTANPRTERRTHEPNGEPTNRTANPRTERRTHEPNLEPRTERRTHEPNLEPSNPERVDVTVPLHRTFS